MLECDYIVKQMMEIMHICESRPAGGRTQACGESTTAG